MCQIQLEYGQFLFFSSSSDSQLASHIDVLKDSNTIHIIDK